VGQPYDAVALEFPVGCFFVKDDFARDNGARIRPIVDALREAGLWANSNPRASAEILAAASGLDVAVIASTKRVVYPRRALVPADVQPLIEVAARYGVIPSSFPAQEVIWKG
jgi:ABC-type nitrate/sulfonate/bicarbonate transport system substrate-binding protein